MEPKRPFIRFDSVEDAFLTVAALLYSGLVLYQYGVVVMHVSRGVFE